MSTNHRWKLKDTIIVDIVFIVYLLGTIILLMIKSILFLSIFLVLYIITNLLLAIICRECPYSGQFCPGVSQLLFGPLISKKIIKEEKITQKTLQLTLILYAIIGLGNFISALVFLFFFYWKEHPLIVVFVSLSFMIYSIIAWPIFCPKCIIKNKCPVRNFRKVFSKDI